MRRLLLRLRERLLEISGSSRFSVEEAWGVESNSLAEVSPDHDPSLVQHFFELPVIQAHQYIVVSYRVQKRLPCYPVLGFKAGEANIKAHFVQLIDSVEAE